jgi:predicted ATPase
MLAGERGALLVLDDMQWAARAELEVIEALLDEPEDAAVLVLVLHRHSSDMAGLPIRAGHPRLAHHQLPPLSLAEIEALADLSALSGVPASPAQSVWRATGGNPLLATELLEIGDAPRSRGGARVGQLVTERLAVLPAAAEEVLRLAAVAGLEFEPPLVAAASTAGRDAAMTLLEAARGAHLLVGSPADPGRLAFRHGLVRDALLERMSPEARAGLHRRLGVSLEEGSEALGGASHNPAALAGLAYHFAAAAPLGDWRRAIRYALPVARRALEAGVYEDVIALTSRALAALAQAGDPDPDARLEVQVLLGAAQRALGDEHASQTLADAFDAAEDRGDAARMCDAALASSGSGAWSDGMYVDDRQLEHYERALQALDPGEHARRARLLARRAPMRGSAASPPRAPWPSKRRRSPVSSATSALLPRCWRRCDCRWPEGANLPAAGGSRMSSTNWRRAWATARCPQARRCGGLPAACRRAMAGSSSHSLPRPASSFVACRSGTCATRWPTSRHRWHYCAGASAKPRR